MRMICDDRAGRLAVSKADMKARVVPLLANLKSRSRQEDDKHDVPEYLLPYDEMLSSALFRALQAAFVEMGIFRYFDKLDEEYILYFFLWYLQMLDDGMICVSCAWAGILFSVIDFFVFQNMSLCRKHSTTVMN